jgi:hypothetical protein
MALTSSDSYANNAHITNVGGEKTVGEMGNAWLKRETSPGNFTKLPGPMPLNFLQSKYWGTDFIPPSGNWTNGNYRAYVQNTAETDEDEGATFTVVDP